MGLALNILFYDQSFLSYFLEKLSKYLACLLENNTMRKNSIVMSLTLCLCLSYMPGGNCLGAISTVTLEDKGDLIISYIERNEMSEADVALTDLVANIASADPLMLESTVGRVSLAYWNKGEYANIEQLASEIINRRPDAAMWAHNYKARTAFKRGDYVAVDASCQKLLSEYSHQNNATWVLNEIACYYQNEEQNDKARQLYEAVVRETPAGNSHLLRTYAELTKMDVLQGDFVSANIRCQNILSDYPNHPMLDELINRVYLAYWNKGNYAKIEELATAVIGRQPDASKWAHNYKVRTALKRGDYSAVDASCQKLLYDYSLDGNTIWSINEVAYSYQNKGNRARARELYNSVIQNAPEGSVNLLRSYAELARMDVQKGDLGSADSYCIKILADFSREPLLDENINRITTALHKRGEYNKVIELASAVINKQPNNAMRAHVRKALASFRLSDYAASDASCQVLAANYNHTDAAWGVREVAMYYLRDYEYVKAAEMYQLVIDTWPDDRRAILSRATLLAIPIWHEDQETAAFGFEQMLEDLGQHKDLAEAALVFGEEYYEIGETLRTEGQHTKSSIYYQKAIDIWEQEILYATTRSKLEVNAYIFSGICYQRLKQYNKALEYYSKVIQDWPDYKYLPKAFSWYENCLTKMRQLGLVTTEEAVLLAEQAFNGFIEDNPDHPRIVHSLQRLGNVYFHQQFYYEAINCYEEVVDKDIDRLKYVQKYYCKALEAVGSDDTAEEVRRVLAEIETQEE